MNTIESNKLIPNFNSITIDSINELKLIDRERILDKSSLVLLKIKDLSIDHLYLIESELKRLKVEKLGFHANKYYLTNNEINEIKSTYEINLIHLDETKLKKTIDFSFDESKTRMSFLSDESIENFKIQVFAHATNGKYLALTYGKEVISLIVIVDVEIDCEQKSLVSWVWIHSGLDFNLKKIIRSQIVDWLKENSLQNLFASIHLENWNSIKFFSKIGFAPQCLFIKK